LIAAFALTAISQSGCRRVDTKQPDTSSDSDSDGDMDMDVDTDGDADTCSDTDISSGPYLWHAFYGGAGTDYSKNVATGPDERIVAVGYSAETWNGPSGEAPLHAHTGVGDMFALALSPDGTYLFHTFFGSPEGCVGVAATFTAGGNVVVVGTSGGTWDGPSGEAPLAPFTEDSVSGNGDAFVLALTADGDYMWHTFFGSTSGETATGVAADASGGVVIAGIGGTVWNGPGGEAPLHQPMNDLGNAFVVTLDENGAYAWHTFYGPLIDFESWYAGVVGPRAAIAPTGEVIVSATAAQEFDGDEGAEPLNPCSGASDAVVLTLAPDGGYLWHTFYGGGGSPGWSQDAGAGVSVSPSGTIAIAGASRRSWTGPGGEAPLHEHSDDPENPDRPDMFALALDAGGGYAWHTFYGETQEDESRAIAVTPDGGFVFVGMSDIYWDGPLDEPPLAGPGGSRNGVIVRLGENGTYAWHEFFGDGAHSARSVAADDTGGIVVIGDSLDSWDGPCDEPPLHQHSGGWDLAIVKLAE
jgi:hypothetical protein